jgi:ribose 5-phosphate isomerase B
VTRIAVGADHAGFEMKELLAGRLRELGHEVIDLGTYSDDRVDYPEFGAAVGRAVAGGEADLGICSCGSGIGVSIAANKIPGVRAATVHDVTSARLSREHNDANVMCVGARFVGPQVALDALDAFVTAEFENGRHAARVAALDALLPNSKGAGEPEATSAPEGDHRAVANVPR